MENRLVRLPEVLKRIARASSSFYKDVEHGLFPAPIKVRGRSFWRDDEVSAMVDAYTGGLSESELRIVSAYLMGRRLEHRAALVDVAFLQRARL